MKKLILLLVVLSAITYSCSNEELQSEVDLSPLKKSSLKSLISESKEIRTAMKQRIKEKLVSQVERKKDTPPGDETEGCYLSSVENEARLTHSPSEVSNITEFNNDSRSFRDNTLQKGQTGLTYKDTYYYLSTYLNNDEVSLKDVNKFLTILPTVNKLYGKMEFSDNDRVVIDIQEKQEIIDFIDYISPKIQGNGSINQQIITAIKSDLDNLTNRNSKQIKQFIEE
jgi:hypothetical protein